MQTNSKNITKLIITFWTIWVLLFGISLMNIDMITMEDNVNCPLDGHLIAICQLNPMEHIQEWQSMFASLPAKDATSIFSLILILLALKGLRLIDKYELFKLSRLELYLNIFHLNRIPIFDPLKEAFSKGILNTKIYS